jgi:hypothetical protein
MEKPKVKKPADRNRYLPPVPTGRLLVKIISTTLKMIRESLINYPTVSLIGRGSRRVRGIRINIPL